MPRIMWPSTNARGRRVVQLELHAPGLAHDVDFEIGVAIEDRARVVGFAAAVEHRQRAAAIQRIQAAARRIEQPVDFLLREVFEAAARRDPRVDSVGVLRRRRKSRRRRGASSRLDLDRYADPGAQPDVDHVRVAERDAAVGPVLACVEIRGLRGMFGWPWIMIAPPGSTPCFLARRPRPPRSGRRPGSTGKNRCCGLRRTSRYFPSGVRKSPSRILGHEDSSPRRTGYSAITRSWRSRKRRRSPLRTRILSASSKLVGFPGDGASRGNRGRRNGSRGNAQPRQRGRCRTGNRGRRIGRTRCATRQRTEALRERAVCGK